MGELSPEAMKDKAEQPPMQEKQHPSADLIELLAATHVERQQQREQKDVGNV